MSLKKIIGALAMSAIMACTLVGMVGCNNSEQVIRDGVTEWLQQYKDVDQAAIDEVDEAIPSTYMNMLGITPDELAHAIFEGFDYTVDSVTVNGDNAEAVVTITAKNLGDLADQISNLQTEVTDDPSQFAGMGTDEIYAWLGSKLMEYINNAPIETGEPLALKYVKNGNTWEQTAASELEMQNAIFG